MKKKYDKHKNKRFQIRKDKLEDGFFDGRFVERSEKPKNKYKRKKKYKDDWFQED